MRFAAILALMVAAGCVPVSETSDVLAQIPNRAEPEIDVLRVVDGDTIELCVRRSQTCGNARLVGFDTPETFRPSCASEAALGEAAKERLLGLLTKADEVDFRFEGEDKYQRPLVSLTLDGRPLADLMVQSGLARYYSGGRRQSWCA